MTDPTPEFGKPQGELPRKHPRALGVEFWGKVVAYLKSDPELWHPLLNSPFKETSLRNIASAKNGTQSSRQLSAALSDPHIQVQFRSKVLYLRWTETP